MKINVGIISYNYWKSLHSLSLLQFLLNILFPCRPPAQLPKECCSLITKINYLINLNSLREQNFILLGRLHISHPIARCIVVATIESFRVHMPPIMPNELFHHAKTSVRMPQVLEHTRQFHSPEYRISLPSQLFIPSTYEKVLEK